MEINSNDELICPLTQAIPIDPVLGTDGQVYEKDAIGVVVFARNEITDDWIKAIWQLSL